MAECANVYAVRSKAAAFARGPMNKHYYYASSLKRKAFEMPSALSGVKITTLSRK